MCLLTSRARPDPLLVVGVLCHDAIVVVVVWLLWVVWLSGDGGQAGRPAHHRQRRGTGALPGGEGGRARGEEKEEGGREAG